MDKIIHVSTKLRCSPPDAFNMFTDSRSLEKWLTKLAEVEPKVGGKYELFWNPQNRENDSTIGCKLLAFEKDKLLSFEWKGPKELKELNYLRPLTSVVVSFFPTNEGTEVHLLHSGWRDSDQWNAAYDYFVRNWKVAFDTLDQVVNQSKM